jgi:hypothetical protein
MCIAFISNFKIVIIETKCFLGFNLSTLEGLIFYRVSVVHFFAHLITILVVITIYWKQNLFACQCSFSTFG